MMWKQASAHRGSGLDECIALDLELVPSANQNDLILRVSCSSSRDSAEGDHGVENLGESAQVSREHQGSVIPVDCNLGVDDHSLVPKEDHNLFDDPFEPPPQAAQWKMTRSASFRGLAPLDNCSTCAGSDCGYETESFSVDWASRVTSGTATPAGV